MESQLDAEMWWYPRTKHINIDRHRHIYILIQPPPQQKALSTKIAHKMQRIYILLVFNKNNNLLLEKLTI